jgi:aspartyl-tRNA(Asn)/glutamyl-tRNA(Gln) amidotransferase subunit A
MSEAELHYATIEQLAGPLQRAELSPVELVEASLARIERLDGRLGVFITVTAEQARGEAREAEREIARGEYRGPMHGVPVSLKDLYDTAGVRTTCGSRILADNVPSEDAAVVRRLREAGAIVIGKTNLQEFAAGPTGHNPIYGVTRNPWNADRLPGGSSSGSGVAVAIGMGCASLGSDSGGSVRIPAALCGVVGLKPTYGLVSRVGIFPLAHSLDHAGPLTRSVRDAAYVLEAIAGHDPRDPTSVDRPLAWHSSELEGQVAGRRGGVLEESLDGVASDVRAVFDTAVDDLRRIGLKVQSVSVPQARHVAGASTAILYAESGTVHQRWLAERPDDYGQDVRTRLELGALLPAVHYLKAQQARSAIMAAFEPIWSAYEVLLTPTTPVVAPPIADALKPEVRSQLVANTRLFNLLGTPACSIPCGFTPGGLPVGLTVAGRAFDEATVLEMSLAFEQATGWKERHPPVD